MSSFNSMQNGDFAWLSYLIGGFDLKVLKEPKKWKNPGWSLKIKS